jgi:hypothetical protein
MERITGIPGWNLLIPVLAIIVFSALHVRMDRDRERARTVEIVLLYGIGIVGFNGVVGFLVHTVWADLAAASIGWATGSPFQQEVAGASRRWVSLASWASAVATSGCPSSSQS